MSDRGYRTWESGWGIHRCYFLCRVLLGSQARLLTTDQIVMGNGPFASWDMGAGEAEPFLADYGDREWGSKSCREHAAENRPESCLGPFEHACICSSACDPDAIGGAGCELSKGLWRHRASFLLSHRDGC